ncbi:MAG: mechanosensitive ion channel domain-containing protein [Candidatus Omnitrophota bacterium]|jgi:small conductance mechanosensitive channel
MREILDKISVYLVQYGLNILAALLIILIGKWLAGMFTRFLEKILVQSKINKTLASFAKNIAYYGLLAFVFLAALNKLGIETTSFIALIGAAGLAVGFALQGTLSNFAAGVMLIIFEPFHAGDFVEAGGAAGIVEEIQIFSTIVKTTDNKKVIVPNSKITGDKIVIYPNSKK